MPLYENTKNQAANEQARVLTAGPEFIEYALPMNQEVAGDWAYGGFGPILSAHLHTGKKPGRS